MKIVNRTDRLFKILVDEDPEGLVETIGAGISILPHGAGGALRVTSKRGNRSRLQEFSIPAGATEEIAMNSENPSLTFGFWMPEAQKYRIVSINRTFNHMQDLHLVSEHLSVPPDDHTSLREAYKASEDVSSSGSDMPLPATSDPHSLYDISSTRSDIASPAGKDSRSLPDVALECADDLDADVWSVVD